MCVTIIFLARIMLWIVRIAAEVQGRFPVEVQKYSTAASKNDLAALSNTDG